MKYKVLGFEAVDYENKSGRRVVGTKIHVAYESEKIDGVGVTTVYVSERIEFNASVGDTIRIIYNQFGGVTDIEVLA